MAEPLGQNITLSVRRPADTPVIFVAGSFSEPKWEPLELAVKTVEFKDDEGLTSTEYLFFRDVQVAPGQYQYRFREGADGPWFHDETTKNGTSTLFCNFIPTNNRQLGI